MSGRHLTLVLALLAGVVATTVAEPLRVAVISDMNGSYGSTRYAKAVDAAIDRIITLRPDLVISTGDMVAGQRRPHLSQQQVEAMWQAFHRRVSDRLAAAGIPLAITPGNHDASAYHGFEGERAIFATQWQARKPALDYIDDSAYPWHYAFAAGETLFISLDVTRVGALEPAQRTWLDTLLTTHGQRYQQRIVFSHVPLWPLAQGRETEFSGDEALESMLQKHAVQLYISGHHHAFYPGHKDGLDLLGTACLGAAPRPLLGADKASPRSLVLLDIDNAAMRLVALESPDFTHATPWRALPATVRSPAATIQRADLAGSDLRELPASAAVPPETVKEN